MRELDFLEETLRLAGDELMGRFRGDLKKTYKPDTSFATEADYASEALILERIRKSFPGEGIIAEESGVLSRSQSPGDFVWVIDPLDGTTNFAHGYPFFCVSIARCQVTPTLELSPMQGGIFDPSGKNIYLAERSKGATRNGVKMKVRESRPLAQSFLVTGFYYTKGEALDFEINRFRAVAECCQSIRRDGSAALDMAMVADGVFDCFWERGLAIWDIAAGALLIEEAGGALANYANPSRRSNGHDAGLFSLEGDGIIVGTHSAVSEISSIVRRFTPS